MRIVCIGISHKTAGVELRERLAFDQAGRARALLGLHRRWADPEFAVLSTCNRVELYTARPVHGHPRAEELLNWLAETHKVPAGEFAGAIYKLTDADATAHLFAVAAGLDSLVPGEAEIAAQVKDAYAAATKAGTTGKAFNEMFQQAFHVLKHVRSETPIGAGKVSVATVAIDCIDKVFDTPAGKHVLSIGAGKMNHLMLKYLSELGAGQIRVANRSERKAKALAATCGGRAVAFNRLGHHLKVADIVITSTASPQPIITAKQLAAAVGDSGGRDMLVVDLAVPRDVEHAAGELDGVALYNIDDLEQIVAANMHRRTRGRKQAEAIIAEHVAETMDKLSVRDVTPTIDALYKKMETILAEELAAAAKRLSTHDDADADEQIMQQALRRTVRRMLHPAAKQLKTEAGSDAARVHIASLRKLFELD